MACSRSYTKFPDPQQHTLYAAEKRFMNDPPPGEMMFKTRSEVKNWLSTLTGKTDFQDAYPISARALISKPIDIKITSGRKHVGAADLSKRVMRLSKAEGGLGMTLPVVLHEFAHFVHQTRSNLDIYTLEEPHGPEFAAVYLDVVALVCGDDEADRLAQDFALKSLDVRHKGRKVENRHPPRLGLIADKRIPRPSGSRTAEDVFAAALAANNKQYDRAWKLSVKNAESWRGEDPNKPEALLRQFASDNRQIFEKHHARGGTLPPQLLEFLGLQPHGLDPVPAVVSKFDQQIAATRRQGATLPSGKNSGVATRCGDWMPRARRRCNRPKHHKGACK